MIGISEIAEFVILLAMLLSAAMAVKSKDLVMAALALALASLMLSLEYFLLQAPDVAIAEASVGAVLTTAIYVFAIRATRRKEVE